MSCLLSLYLLQSYQTHKKIISFERIVKKKKGKKNSGSLEHRKGEKKNTPRKGGCFVLFQVISVEHLFHMK